MATVNDLPTYRALVDGEWLASGRMTDVLDKFTGMPFARVDMTDHALVEQVVSAARRAFDTGFIEPYRRYEILLRASQIVEERFAAMVETMISETGFTRADCRNDLSRAIQTLRTSAEEAKRVVGEVVPIHAAPGQTSDRLAYTVRDPIGVVCAITPFNSPFNTVCHKVGPALAAGNSVVLKPATYTPASAAALCDILVTAGLPGGWLNLVYGDGSDVGRWLVENQKIDFYTFTGSTGVGRSIQHGAGLRRTQMELGSVSGTIVCADANLDHALQRCVASSFRKAGQVCTSVQRLIVESSIMEEFTAELARRAGTLRYGDPRDDNVAVGPMIAAREAERAESWIDDAVTDGAILALSDRRAGAVLPPTILTNVKPRMRVFSEEIFAPVVSIVPFDNLDEAINIVNDTPFGLAAGIFTTDIDTGLRAAKKVRVGAFHINDTSSSRVDLMPYGGVKDSGFGLEGPKYAIRDMTEERLITITPSRENV